MDFPDLSLNRNAVNPLILRILIQTMTESLYAILDEISEAYADSLLTV